MADYITSQQLADRLGVTRNRVLLLLSQGRITGAMKHGRDWLIPADATVIPKPAGRPPVKKTPQRGSTGKA